jgi:hypothetical protein
MARLFGTSRIGLALDVFTACSHVVALLLLCSNLHRRIPVIHMCCRYQGQFDSPLTKLGKAQAEAVGKRLKREQWRFDVVVSSDLGRAANTANIIRNYCA